MRKIQWPFHGAKERAKIIVLWVVVNESGSVQGTRPIAWG
jgi:hypothetical protein